MVKPFGSPVSSPRKSSRKNKENHKVNPFSSSGLDKFTALLAEHEEKRREIYSKIDPKDAPIVRFLYTDSNQCVPVLIKTKESKTPRGGDSEDEKIDQDYCRDKGVIHESRFSGEFKRCEINEFEEEDEKLKPCEIMKTNLRHKLKRPGFYLFVTVILILAFLAVFGRFVAILCTAIGWYLVSVMKGGRSDGQDLRKKKDFVKRLANESPKVRDVADFKEKFPFIATKLQIR